MIIDDKKYCNHCKCSYYGEYCPLCNKNFDEKKEKISSNNISQKRNNNELSENSQRLNIRAGINQARFNSKAIKILIFECIYVAIIAGFITKSWLIFGAVAICFISSFFFKKMAFIVCIALAICMAVAGFFIGYFFFSLIAGIIISILSLIIGLLINLSASGWINDMRNRF